MKRHLLAAVVTAVVGTMLLGSDAQACHKNRCTCAPVATCVAVVPEPCPRPHPLRFASRPVLPGSISLCSLASRESSLAVTRRPRVRHPLPLVGHPHPVERSLIRKPLPIRPLSPTRHPLFTPPPKRLLNTEPTLRLDPLSDLML